MLLFVVGAVVLQQAVFGGYLDYVKPAQGPWLIVAGLALAAIGLVGMLAGEVPTPIARRDYPPLPAGSPVALAVHDYAERAAWDGGRTLGGRTVTLTGFVTPDGDAHWSLSRIMITCCAADSRSYLVAIDGGGRPPVADSWQQVTGTWVPSPPAPDGGPPARLAASTVTPVATPPETYELPRASAA